MGPGPPLPGRGLRLSVALRRVSALAPRSRRALSREPGSRLVDVQGHGQQLQEGGCGPRIGRTDPATALAVGPRSPPRIAVLAGFAFMGQTVAQLYGRPGPAVNAWRASIAPGRPTRQRTWPGPPGAPAAQAAATRPDRPTRTDTPGAGARSSLTALDLPLLLHLQVPGLELVGPLHQGRQRLQERLEHDLATRGPGDLGHVIEQRRDSRREIQGQPLPIGNNRGRLGERHRFNLMEWNGGDIVPRGTPWRPSGLSTPVLLVGVGPARTPQRPGIRPSGATPGLPSPSRTNRDAT